MSTQAEPVRGKKIKELEVMVANVIQETPDTCTLVFFTGNDRLDYKAGHFCTIDPHQFPALQRFTAYLEDVKGKKEPPRAYSLASAPHEKYVAITVKEETYVKGETKYPPLLSPLLVRHLPPGTRLTITGFTGPYFLPDDVESQTDHVVHIVAGSGAVPNFSIVKDALHRGLKLRHTFICSNKTYEDICFRPLLDQLAKAHPDRFQLVHTLTREKNEALFGQGIRKGRISRELIGELVPDLGAALFYVCGPAISPWDRKAALEKKEAPQPRFLESVMAHLHAMGVDDKRVKRESWG